jgi:NAD-dependent dihydropyrimidine dehydrogenase PreA subunit
MSKKWYPVINYVECAECGVCTGKCSHGVYDADKAPVPVVVNSDSCIEGRHGCGNLCPNGAITYVGDDTGWTPPNGDSSDNGSCSCEGGCC